MTENFEFLIHENTLERLLMTKKTMGFESMDWDGWINYVLNQLSGKKLNQSSMEIFMEKIYYERLYENWVKNFAVNLNDIWEGKSAKDLDPTNNSQYNSNVHSAIVIGSGPSVKKKGHLESLANSNYKDSVVCCDSALIKVLKSGITPDKFPRFYVVTIDTDEKIAKYYDDPIVDKYGKQIHGIFSTMVNPQVVKRAKQGGVKIYWLHALFDYHEGKKSFNQIAALMVRAKKNSGLPAIQTGGNVGTSSWFIAWQILKCSNVALIGINHSWEEEDSWQLITSHGSDSVKIQIEKDSPEAKRLFPLVHNPEFDSNCILDPLFQYYSSALKDFIKRSPSWVNTINATEGGCIFGERIRCISFKDFLSTCNH
jgi:hypothetical protein